MADDTPTPPPIIVGGKPAAASAVTMLRTLLSAAGAVAAVLHFARAAGVLQTLASVSDSIIGGAVAAAGLCALFYGAFSRFRIETKAKTMVNLLPDDTAQLK